LDFIDFLCIVLSFFSEIAVDIAVDFVIDISVGIDVFIEYFLELWVVFQIDHVLLQVGFIVHIAYSYDHVGQNDIVDHQK